MNKKHIQELLKEHKILQEQVSTLLLKIDRIIQAIEEEANQ